MVRMVRRYWDLMGQPERHTIISRKNAYHGSTVAAASLGGMKPMHEQGGLPMPGIEHIEQPYWFGSDRSLSPDEFGLVAARALEKKIDEIGADKIAAFIGEPVQGAGGVIIPPETYWPEIQRICDEYGILLISDEVITGFGRLGEWFGADYYGIQAGPHDVREGRDLGIPAARRRSGRRSRCRRADRQGRRVLSTATPTPATRQPVRSRSPTSA